LSRVAKRYAKALFALAREEKLLDKVEADMNQISVLHQENEDFGTVLSNPLINEKVKLSILNDMFKGKVETLTLNFLALLAEKKRIAFLVQVVEEFRAMMLEFANKVEGELISARTLSEEQTSRIRKNVEAMTGKVVLLTEKVDKSVLGGFVVRVEDWVLDNSIRYQLSKLREKLIAR